MPLADTPPNTLRQRLALSDRSLTIAICAASGFFFLWLLSPVLQGLTFVADDLASQNLPFRKFYADCLSHHESFLWSPDLYSGFYLHGEGQTGMLHPLHLLLYWLLPLTTAFGLEIVCTYVFLFAGSYFLFKAWKLDGPAALFGSFLFTFGGTNLTLLEHMNAVAVTAHLPWVLLAIHRTFETNSPRTRALWLSAIAGLTGSQALLGFPESLWFCGLIEGAYAIYPMTLEVQWRRLFQVVISLVIGLTIGGAQLLPTFTTVKGSVRATPPAEFQSEMSLQPQELLQWVNPLLWKGARYDQFRGLYNYLIYFGGTVTLLLFVWILSRKELKTSQRKLVRFLGILGFAGMFLALGKYNPLFPFYSRLPLMMLFRGPARYTIVADFAVAAGAAFALHHLRELQGDLSLSPLVRRVAILFAIASAASVVLAILPGLIGNDAPFVSGLVPHLASPLVALAGALMVVSAIAVFLIAARIPSIAAPALVIFVLLDVVAIQGSGLFFHNTIGDPYPDGSLPIDAPGPVQARYGDQLLLLNYRLVDGYSGLEPVSPIPIETTIYAKIMGARAVLLNTWKVLPDPLPLVRVRNHAAVMQNRDALLEDSGILARSSLMEHHTTPPNLDRDLDQVLHFDFVHAALVDAPIELDPAASGTISLIEEHPGRMILAANVTGAMLATTGTRYHAGWKMLLDGKPLNTLRVDGSLLGFIVPSGHHRIEGRFDPDDFHYGMLASLLSVSATVIYLAIALIRYRHDRDAGVN